MLAITLIFLAGTFFLTALTSALRRLHKHEAEEALDSLGSWFFYRKFHLLFFSKPDHEGVFFATLCAQNLSRFCYIGGILASLSQTSIFQQATQVTKTATFSDPIWILALCILWLFMLLTFLIGDYLPRVLAVRFPEAVLNICAPLASPFMLLVFPWTYLLLKLSRSFWRSTTLEPSQEPLDREGVLEMLQSADFGTTFDAHERKLIESVVMFKERIAREVMVPRVDVFSLSDDTSIKEAATYLDKEGYSRTPIYHNTVDNIVGVLMYKDILKKYMEYEKSGNDQKILEAPIETIQKNVLHTPETKRISSLLQEFRKKQVHLAIVVDEYGGTEGIVTIEDILEEIVGEIADEYDQEEELFYAAPDSSWIVDARMNILDVEEELGIKIPQDGEYDTIGGYIFHSAGTIPQKGFIIHHEEFDLEILQSNDRCVEKVRIKPVK